MKILFQIQNCILIVKKKQELLLAFEKGDKEITQLLLKNQNNFERKKDNLK